MRPNVPAAQAQAARGAAPGSESPASNAAPVIFSVALDVPSVNSEALDPSNGNRSCSDASRYHYLLVFAGCLLPLAWLGSAIFFTMQYGKMQGYQLTAGEQDVYNYAVVAVILGLFVTLLSSCLYCSGSFILRKTVELLFAFGMLGYSIAVGFHFAPSKHTYASYSLPVATWVVASFVFLIFWISYTLYAIRMHYSKEGKIPWFCLCIGKSSGASSRPTASSTHVAGTGTGNAKSGSKEDEPVFVDASYIEIVKEDNADYEYDAVDNGVSGSEQSVKPAAAAAAAKGGGGGKRLKQRGGSGDVEPKALSKTKVQVEEKEDSILTSIFCGL